MSKRTQMRQRARQQQRTDRTTLWVTLGVVALAAVIIIALVLTRPPAGSTPSTASNAAIPNPEVARIGLADARARFQQPGVVFIDTRSGEEFATSHIPGAINMPLPEVPARFGEIPRDAEVITYCT